MNEQENTKLVKRVYELFKSGETEAFLNMFSDDVSWETPKIENTPFSGRISGKEHLAKWITAYTAAEEMTIFEQDEFVAQGDRIVMLGHCESRTKSTNKKFATNLVHIFTVKDGKITEFLELFDTAVVEKAYNAAAQAA